MRTLLDDVREYGENPPNPFGSGFCRNCGEPNHPEREELGYDYCLSEDCQLECRRHPPLAIVMSHKQGPMVVSLDFAAGQNFMDTHGRLTREAE